MKMKIRLNEKFKAKLNGSSCFSRFDQELAAELMLNWKVKIKLNRK